MTEVAILKSDDSAAAMDLSVKCGRITLRRPPSMDQQPAEAEETLAAFLHGPGRTRGLDGGMPPEWLQQHHRAVIYRPEFDAGHRYPSHFGPMMTENSPEGVPRRNGYGAYPVEMRRHHHHRNNDDDEAMTYAAMQAQRIVTSLPPFNYYVPEMHCSNNNNDDDDDEFMTSSQSMTSSHLTKTDVDPSSAPDCFQFPVSNNNNNNIYDGDGIIGGGGVSSGGSPAGVSAVAPGGEQPMPNGPPSSVHVAPPSPIFFNPRKRFLAEIRKASGPQTSPSSEPNSTTGHHHLAPPTPSSSSSSTDALTPSSTEEKRHLAGTRAGTREGTTVSSFPSTEKDEAYWERRRKNNEAAKRSRDIRRQKEEQVAARAASLSAENVQLRAQIEVLKTQLALIHSMVISGSHRQA